LIEALKSEIKALKAEIVNRDKKDKEAFRLQE
jgi:hypothetical protein